VAAKSHDRHDGPPYFWFAEAAAPAAGKWHATLTLDNAAAEWTTITREIAVSAHKPPGPRAAVEESGHYCFVVILCCRAYCLLNS
jgi:hypothetical protein